MAAHRCSNCALNYPTVYTGICLECDGKLDRIENCDPMVEEDFDARRRARRLRVGDPPRELNATEQAALGRDLEGFLKVYEECEAEALRRGPRWRASDVFEERRAA